MKEEALTPQADSIAERLQLFKPNLTTTTSQLSSSRKCLSMFCVFQFSKHISDFRQVRKEDQIAMLKASAMQTLGIACCAVYVHERDSWLSLRGDLTLTHLRRATHDDPYIQVRLLGIV